MTQLNLLTTGVPMLINANSINILSENLETTGDQNNLEDPIQQ